VSLCSDGVWMLLRGVLTAFLPISPTVGETRDSEANLKLRERGKSL
jgi:hypothetical protein